MRDYKSLYFPTDRVCGRLYLRDQQTSIVYPWAAWPDNIPPLWERDLTVLADASGAVQVPTNERSSVVLQVNEPCTADLSFLAELDPSALDELDFFSKWHVQLDVTPIAPDQLQFIAELTELKRLYLGYQVARGDTLRWLPDLRRLECLQANGSEIADAAMASVARASQIEWLDLSFTAISAAGLAQLRMLPNLKHLTLYGGTGLTVAAWPVLAGLRSLHSLDLGAIDCFADDALLHVGTLDQLETLILSDVAINGEGLGSLQHLGQLRKLGLHQSQVRPLFYEHLRYVPTIENLDLTGVTVSAEALGHISRLPRLRRLRFFESIKSSSGLDALGDTNALEELTLSGSSLDIFGLVALGNISSLQHLDLDGSSGVSDAGISHLAKLDQLRSLTIALNDRGGKGLAALSKLQALERIAIAAPSFDETALRTVGNLRRLKHFQLHCPNPIGGGLEFLSRLVELSTLDLSSVPDLRSGHVAQLHSLSHLRTVRLTSMPVDNEIVCELGALADLTKVDLSGTGVSDKGVEGLQYLEKLTSLDLSGTLVSNAGLAIIARLLNLEELDVSRTMVDDGVIPYLLQFPKLEKLTVSGSNISDMGVTQLAHFLPNCRVQ